MEAESSSKNNSKYLLIKIMSYPIGLKSSSTLQWGLQILHISMCQTWLFTHHKQTDEWVCWAFINSMSQELIYGEISIPYVSFSCNYGSLLMVLKNHPHTQCIIIPAILFLKEPFSHASHSEYPVLDLEQGSLNLELALLRLQHKVST